MATTGKKEYTLKINGVDTAVKDFTTLEAAVKSLDSTLEKERAVITASTKATTEKTKALSEEEKAAKKLEETQKKIKAAQEGANDAQIKANQALRDATREQTLRIKSEQASANSVEQLRAELARLTQEWKNLDMGSAKFQELTAQISETSNKLKAAEGSVGDFRRNVGDYENAIKSAIVPTQGFTGQLAAMAQAPGGIIAGLNGMTKAALTFIATPIGATITAIVAVVSAFSKGIRSSEENTAKFNKILAPLQVALDAVLNVLQKTVGWILDYVSFSLKAADATVGFIASLVGLGDEYDKLAEKAREGMELEQRKLDLAQKTRKLNEEEKDQQVKIAELRNKVAQKDKYTNEERLAYLDEAIKKETDIAEKRKAIAEENLAILKEEADRAGNDAKVNEKLSAATIAVSEAKLNLMNRTRELNAQRVEAINAIKAESEEEIRKAREVAEATTGAVRTAEDARVKLIRDSNEQARKQIELTYDRQIEDLRKRLATEEDLTKEARAALNDTIVSLEQQKGLDLEKLEKEQAERALALQQEVEDSRISLIVGNYDRQTAEINAQYDRQIDAYKKRLAEEEALTEEQQQQITELIENAQKARSGELLKLAADDLQARADLELSKIDEMLAAAERKTEDAVSRKNGGAGLIDVKATRDNLEEANRALDDYINHLSDYKKRLTQVHEATLATLKKGTSEYEAELQRYAHAMNDTTRRIADAQTQQAENTEKSSAIQLEALQELFGKIAEYADAAAQTITAVTDTLSMGLQVQIDDLNEQLDVVSQRYEEAQKLREDAAKNVEDIEARLQEATGGTAEALKVQLMEEMHAREEAAREEQRLAKEKEKLEANIAKKEKQLKRNQLISDIANTTAGVAQAVVNALKMEPFIPLGLLSAATASSMGAVQLGIMTRQLTKLADGGEIIGPSHANGGVPIPGTNYEVEGGEFVVNKRSYGANASLVKFINDTPRAITAADLIGVVPGDNTPVGVTDAGQASEDRIVEAINGINIRPVVSVTDINDVNDEVVTVEDLAGF